MTYHEAFDATGKRRIFAKRGRKVAGVFVAVAVIVVWAVITGGFQS